MKKSNLKKGDKVIVLTGKDKGKTGSILKVDLEKERVLVEGLNIVKKTVRRRSEQDKGGIIEIEAPLHISNVMLVDGKGNRTRVGYKFEKDGAKVRYSKKSGEAV